jgi:hypothetical protein
MSERRATMDKQTVDAEVFLSYSHEDREAALRLSEALGQKGFSVWWDRTILVGRNYQNEIEQALQGSRCVIVLWSRHSVVSDWVKEEASYARSQGKLIPLLLDDAEIPVPFTLIQRVKLRDRDGSYDDEDFQDLMNGVRDSIRKSTGARIQPEFPGPRTPNLRPILVSWAWLILPSLLVGGLALLLMIWRVPTLVEIDVTASSVNLYHNQTSEQMLLSSVPLRSLSIRGLRSVSLPVSVVAVANPKNYEVEHDSYGEDGWTGVNSGPTLYLSAENVNPSPAQVTFRPDVDPKGSMVIESISMGGAKILLTSPGKNEARLKLIGARISGAVGLPETLMVDTQYLVKDDFPFPFHSSTQRLRLNVLPGNNSARYSAEGSMLYDLELAQGGRPLVSSFPVDRIDFLSEGRSGSAINGEGSIRYLECPRSKSIAVNPSDILTLGDLSGFYLRKVSLTEQAKSIRIKADGRAGQVKSGPNGNLQDRRMTRFDLLWNNQRLVALLTALSWLVATSLALRKYLKDNSGA